MKGDNELKSHLAQDFAKSLDITQSLLTFPDSGMPVEHVWMECLDAGLTTAKKGVDINNIGLFLPRHGFEECEFAPPQDPNARKQHFDTDELRETQRRSKRTSLSHIDNVMVLSPMSPKKGDNLSIPNLNQAPNSQRRAPRYGVDVAVRNSAA
mmetsp:Transcript_24913/g.35698  ORF Transcript_24913/g.35698 Transcript_24913/m.35698 type:complete len:153 (-) Transcript_24913:266-724(-)